MRPDPRPRAAEPTGPMRPDPSAPPLKRQGRPRVRRQQSGRRLGCLTGLDLLLLTALATGPTLAADCVDDRIAHSSGLVVLTEPSAADPAATAALPTDCLADATTLASEIRTGRRLAVDVRPSTAFAAAHIPGSANVPAFALPTKAFLRERPLALVGNGFDRSVLLRLCGRLREQGFTDVSVLRGGVAAWRQSVGDLAGGDAVWSPVERIAPRDLFRERKHAPVTLIDLTAALAAAGGAKSAPREAAAEQVRAASAKTEMSALLVTYTADGSGYDLFQQLQLSGPDGRALFFLADGERGWRSYLAQRAKRAVATQDRHQRGGPCGAPSPPPANRAQATP